MPGTVAYGSKYRNEHTWAHHQVFNAGTYRRLVDYGPTTTSGATTVSVSLATAAGPSGPPPWNYTISDVAVLDGSDFSQHVAYWQHDIDREAAVGRNTYLSKPDFVVETGQDHWSFVDACYQVRFVKSPFWCGKTLESPTLYLGAFLAGD